jgi:hypothetical protein
MSNTQGSIELIHTAGLHSHIEMFYCNRNSQMMWTLPVGHTKTTIADNIKSYQLAGGHIHMKYTVPVHCTYTFRTCETNLSRVSNTVRSISTNTL